MAQLSSQAINAAYFSAFGRNATKEEIAYWSKKQDTELRDKLRADKKAKGTYDRPWKSSQYKSEQEYNASQQQGGGAGDGGGGGYDIERAKANVKEIYTDILGWEPSEKWLQEEALVYAKQGGAEEAERNLRYAIQTNRDAYLDKAALSKPYRDIIDESKRLLDRLKETGQTVNPNIDITPEHAAEFMRKAESEIDPYFSQNLNLARNQFLTSLGYAEDDILRFEANLDRQYRKGREQIGESAAERGFAQSGIRAREEQDLQRQTQQTIDESRTVLNRRTDELAKAFTGQYGYGYLPKTTTIAAAPRAGIEGLEGMGTTDVPFYQLSPEIYGQIQGEQEYQRRAALRGRASELEAALRQSQELERQRSLTI